MKIIHCSDTHGYFPDISKLEGDLIIHSGDLFPNLRPENTQEEIKFQTAWLSSRIETFRSWLGERPLIFCSGNHDYISPQEILNEHGIDATDINDRIHISNGVSFYGFPYIPYFWGGWNYELTSDEMSRKIRELKNILLESKIDVLVAHGPIAGVLDLCEEEYLGNVQMYNLFTYGLDSQFWPRIFCHGHIHESGGQTVQVGDMLVSNAACHINQFEIKNI